jgi:glycosyltransferase involved in cell wall biosynthesis
MRDAMKVLFTHQNFPGQYLHLARHFGSQSGHQAVFITQRQDTELPGVRKIVYKPRRTITPQVHHYLRESEAAVLNAQEVARVALDLRKAGFTPDVMLGHNGWGEIWYLKEIYPNTPLIGYFEFFYRLQGADVDFEPNANPQLDTGPRIRTKNLGNLLGLDCADAGQCPTRWQHSLYPERYHSMLRVIHEGVDTRKAVPNPKAKLVLPDGRGELSAGDEVVTYVARNLEPYRGFVSFMRSLPTILQKRPKAQVVIVGGDDVSYGARLPEGKTFREETLKQLNGSVDLSRVHFLGKVPYSTFLTVLQISRVHVYLTYPFVLSWSMLEAMSVGCLIVGSRTPPVEEAVHSGFNGLLVDFFSIPEIAQRTIEALEEPKSFEALRANARRTILQRYDLYSQCLPAQMRLIHDIVHPTRPYIWTGTRRVRTGNASAPAAP